MTSPLPAEEVRRLVKQCGLAPKPHHAPGRPKKSQEQRRASVRESMQRLRAERKGVGVDQFKPRARNSGVMSRHEAIEHWRSLAVKYKWEAHQWKALYESLLAKTVLARKQDAPSGRWCAM